MNKKIAYIVGSSFITVTIDNRVFTVSKGQEKFESVKQALVEKDYEKLDGLLDIKEKINSYFGGNITVKNGAISYKGKPIDNYAATKALEFIKNKFPYEALLKFLNRLMENPSKRSVDELYRFLEKGNLPITDEGYFLAFKSLQSNFTDWFSGKFSNTVGTVHEMARNEVSDDMRVRCSFGRHVGTKDYAVDFNNKPGRKIVIVEVDPADVVSISDDANCGKIRVCKYKVVSEYTEEIGDLYTSKYTPSYSSKNDETDYSEECGDYYDDSVCEKSPKRDSKGRFCK